MKRFIKVIPVIAFLFCVACIANAQTVRSTFGNPVSGIYNLEEKTDGIVYQRPTGGFKSSYENKTTSDTLTLAECGRTITYSGPVTSVFTLPTADVGCWFKFVATTDDSAFAVNPNGSEQIHWSENGTLFLTAGDQILSGSATQDSIEVFCSVDQEWAVAEINGTFSDND